MTDTRNDGATALQAAIAHVQKHAAKAGFAAMLTPLALAAGTTRAEAASLAPPVSDVTITGSTSPAGALTTFTYIARSGRDLVAFEIPELRSGDLTFVSGPTGWTATIEAARTQTNTSLKSGTLPGAYVLLAASSPSFGLGEGGGTFRFTTALPSTTSANFGVTVDQATFNPQTEGYVYTTYETGYVDPPVPAGTPVTPVTPVPEPASMLLLGGAVLAAGATRTRQKG